MNLTKPFILLVSLICINLSAEVKRTQEYRFIEFQIDVNSELTYAVAVLDRREVVTSGSQEPDFVGYVRSTTGIAWPIRTESSDPFTDDVTFTIRNAIEKTGAQFISISTEYSMDPNEVIEKLKTTKADKLLLVIINKWRSDTKSYFSKTETDMIWDITLQVHDTEGEPIVENNVNGLDDGVSPSKMTNEKKRQEIIDVYYREKMEELFSDESVQTNLME